MNSWSVIISANIAAICISLSLALSGNELAMLFWCGDLGLTFICEG